MRRVATLTLALAFGALPLAAMTAASALAYDQPVKKESFTIKDFKTQSGAVVKEMKLGWEAYGTLNAAKDNAILVTHFFSGNSHAAGKYKETDAAPGYWDSIIGAGKPLDTNKYYVLSVDTPANLNPGDTNVITTGPATTNPDTGKPYGMSFPILSIRDFVETQAALLDQLGIGKLQAVMGASMGALQAYEWASSHPDRVTRLIPVIGTAYADADLIAWMGMWADPIRIDANWNGGDYYGKTPPAAGLAAALKLVTLQAQSHEFWNATYGRAWAKDGADPLASFANRFKVEEALDAVAAARAKVADANHLLYLVKANQAFYAGQGAGKTVLDGLRGIKAPTLLIFTPEDLVFPEDAVRETGGIIRAGGNRVDYVELQGTRGHLDGVVQITQAGPAISAFLAK